MSERDLSLSVGLHKPATKGVIQSISRAIDAEADVRVKLLRTLPGDVSRVWEERVRRAHRAFKREAD